MRQNLNGSNSGVLLGGNFDRITLTQKRHINQSIELCEFVCVAHVQLEQNKLQPKNQTLAKTLEFVRKIWHDETKDTADSYIAPFEKVVHESYHALFHRRDGSGFSIRL